MQKIGAYSPETARLVLDVVRYLRESGFVILPPTGADQKLPPPTPIFVRNDSGETIPAWACMQSTGAVEYANQNYITVGKPVDITGAAGSFLFNGQQTIESGGYGVAYAGPLARSYKSSGSFASGGKCRPTVGQWYITIDTAGQWSMVGEDDIGTGVVRIYLGSSGNDYSSIEYKIVSTRVATDSGDEAPYNGLTIATVTVKLATPDKASLIGTQVDVVDHSGCIFDLTSAELVDIWGWASWRVAESLASGASPGDLTPPHWSADDRCC